MTSDDFDQRVRSVAALGETVRRELYRFVVAQPEPVSREAAAAGVGVPRHVAKFHLDKLEDDGLLEAEYRRPPGRRGPGAGRPAKVYHRAPRHISVNLPERRYDLASHIFAEAIGAAQRTGLAIDGPVSDAARAAGRALAERARVVAEGLPPAPDALDAAGRALSANGYEPRPAADRITLANCPFHELAQDHTALVCGINLDLINGLLDALPAPGVRAVLDPAPGRCCVTLTASGKAA